ncbi:AAA family ATPase [Paraburkholderia bannensis]|uniref:AAA family ATPase n=1 Tax=Paraburkholderia bannensis TaxID=765414 RepID=UPI000A03DD98|nr:AAA family ATPase [Paraburkholderia bannensis]
MIDSIHFEDFRCFTDFTVSGLNRINLFVGMNNSGKSTLLEGLHFVESGNWNSLLQVLLRRGWLKNVFQQSQLYQYVDVRHSLFNVKSLAEGKEKFSIETRSKNGDFDKLQLGFVSPSTPSDAQLQLLTSPSENFLYQQLGAAGVMLQGQVGLKAEYSYSADGTGGSFSSPKIPLFEGSDVRFDTFNHLGMMVANQRPQSRVLFITPDANDIGSANNGWSKIAFNEDLVSKIVKFLRIMIPDIEGLQTLQQTPNTLSSFFIKLKGVSEPQPLGSFGDGVRHILFLLLAFPNTQGGRVYIDEIGSAIHHSLTTTMWTVISEFARFFNVQVFATTHSLDCIRGLSRVSINCDDIAAHRIDSRRKKSVHYDFEEIAAAVDEDQEIRGV